MNTNAIIGKVVEFTTQKDASSHGVVLGVENILHNNNTHVVTGYLIQDTLGKLHHVIYWRLSKIIENSSSKQPPYPKEQAKFVPKREHNFTEEEADDLPF